jgi:general secretion pathway protein I
MRRTSDRGFTLIEVLAALLIAAVALTYLLQSETASIRISNAARDLREATLLAKMKLAEIVAGAEGETSGSFENRPEWSWDSTREPVSEPIAMTKVIVKAAYRSAGQDQTVSLEQIIE